MRFLGLKWFAPYQQVLDSSRGFAVRASGSSGARRTSPTTASISTPRAREPRAIIWEGENGDTRTLTYTELRRETDALAAPCVARGIGAGDAVGIFMPMVPETAAALLAIAKLGAVSLPIFSGYAADAVAIRLSDAGSQGARHRRRMLPPREDRRAW